MTTCSKCGTINANDATFCQSCGNNLSEGGSAYPSQPYNSANGSSSTFDIRATFSDAIALVKNPTTFMTARSEQDQPLKSLIINYVAVLAAVPFIATLIGYSWYYRFFSIFGGGGIAYILGITILSYILDIIAVFVIGFIMWKLAPTFGTSTTQVRATRMAAYIFTPYFLISILNIVPFIGFLTILGVLYGLYIMYLGLPIVMKTPKEKVLGYLIVTVVATIVVYAVIGAIVGAIVAATVLTGFAFL